MESRRWRVWLLKILIEWCRDQFRGLRQDRGEKLKIQGYISTQKFHRKNIELKYGIRERVNRTETQMAWWEGQMEQGVVV